MDHKHLLPLSLATLLAACRGNAPDPVPAPSADTLTTTATWSMAEVPYTSVTGWDATTEAYMGAPHIYLSRFHKDDEQYIWINVVVPHKAGEQYLVTGPPVEMEDPTRWELMLKRVVADGLGQGLSVFRNDAAFALGAHDQLRVSIEGSAHYEHLYINGSDAEEDGSSGTIPLVHHHWIGTADLGHWA